MFSFPPQPYPTFLGVLMANVSYLTCSQIKAIMPPEDTGHSWRLVLLGVSGHSFRRGDESYQNLVCRGLGCFKTYSNVEYNFPLPICHYSSQNVSSVMEEES